MALRTAAYMSRGKRLRFSGEHIQAWIPLLSMQPHEGRYILTMLKYTVLGIVALLALTSGVPVCLEFALNLGGASHATEVSGKFYNLS